MSGKTVKKPPERRCTGCGERFEKSALIRIVRSQEGEVALDRTGRAAGRGAYICHSLACLRRARKTRRLEQAFAAPIPDEVYDALEGELKERE